MGNESEGRRAEGLGLTGAAAGNPTTAGTPRRGMRRLLALIVAGAVAGCLLAAGCAPQPRSVQPAAESEAEEAAQPAAFTWSADADCAMCHDKEAASQQDAACGAAQHGDVACVTCHSDEAGLATAHEGAAADGKGATALVQTAVAEEVCAGCHDVAALAEATADSTVLTDSEGTVVNPHAIPENGDHEATECTSCHKMHSSTGVEKTATRYCKSCHHTDVYQCNTCHA